MKHTKKVIIFKGIYFISFSMYKVIANSSLSVLLEREKESIMYFNLKMIIMHHFFPLERYLIQKNSSRHENSLRNIDLYFIDQRNEYV